MREIETESFRGHKRPFLRDMITKHLKLLERAGLIARERQGREVMISLRPEPLRLVSGWVHEYERFWTDHLDRFEQHFKDKRRRKP